MPCNKAVSIVKAALTDEASAKLLTEDVLVTVVGSYLSQQGYTDWDSGNATTRTSTFRVVRATDNGGVSVTIQSDGLNATFHITAGGRQVSTSLPSYRPATEIFAAEALVGELTQLLDATADMLFAQQVHQALSALGYVQAEAVTVEDEGQYVAATKLTINL